MKRLRWFFAVLWLGLACSLLPRVQANTGPVPALHPQAGQWLVCVASYTGPEAQELAEQLANWIRAKQNTPVYLFNRSDEERKKLNEEYARRGLKKAVRVEDQYAVLVGGYNDLDTAGKARDVIRKWPLPDLKLASGKSAFDLETTVMIDPDTGKQQATSRPINPFASALPIRNPLAPRATNTSKFDPFLKKLNEGEEYSLLTNPKPWTLAVKQYAGGAFITDQPNSTSLWDKLFGKSQGEMLDAAGKQAHELARVLRKLGFQAWVLHTRQSSVVTVGGYDRPDDPEMEKMKSRLSQLTQQVIANNAERRDPFQLFSPPLPMEVPRPDR